MSKSNMQRTGFTSESVGDTIFSLVGGTVLTIDMEDKVIPSGTVVVENGTITNVGKANEVEPRGTIYNVDNHIVMPGLINTHTHSVSPLFRNMADDLHLMDWLKTLIWPAEQYLTAEHAYWGARLAFLEFVENGITSCADQYFFAASVAEAVKDTGITCLLSPSIFSGPSPESKNTLETALKVIERYSGHEEQTGVIPAIGPHAPYSCNSDTWDAVVTAAREHKLIIHTHISETLDENRMLQEQQGMSPSRFLESRGVFENRVLAAHCIHLDKTDMQIFKESNASVSYNPVSNLKLVSGIMPLQKLLSHGITVGIGTDGAQSNNSLDLLTDLKIGVLIQKQKQENAAFFTARQALRMATIEGARSLHLEEKIGSLEIGKRADIITIDTEEGLQTPFYKEHPNQAFSAVVYNSHGSKVSNTIANGNFLKKNGRVLMDKQEILERASSLGRQLMQSAGLL